jgi:GT2 family glycosyltransferase
VQANENIAIVIPNYNGVGLLKANLPSLRKALDRWGGQSEVLVVDDCSTDDSRRVLAEQFPWAKVLANETNAGFSKACNLGMLAVKQPIALCLNNDVRVAADLIAPLLKHFADPEVFAVTPNILAERDGRNQGIVFGLYGRGFIKGSFAPLEARSSVRENLYAVGACVAYDMKKFRALGGFAEIYSPYLCEDMDLSYRAWKRGWKSIYEPGTTAYHYSSATIGKTRKRHKRTIYFRNRFLFHWINLTDPVLVCRNRFHTLLRLSFSFLWFDFTYYAAFWGGLRRWGEARALRRNVKAHLQLSDADILRRTRKPPILQGGSVL